MGARTPVVIAFALTALAACANDPTPASSASSAPPPVSNDPLGTSMLMPQSPNSLPPGAAVNAPLTSPTGNLVTTPVSPVPRTQRR